ncbi:uncharacterized protein [Nicotiana sylvestris]|uniref:uncharacterized protein n=1 Tax=Nicotiana sylvestris TaxID=4096 RepID=UPI00388CD2E3
MYKAEQDRRLIQFLMGLNEIYTVVRGSILMMNPLPNLAQAFSLPVQDEKQREIRPTNHLTVDSTSLNVSTSGQSSFKTNFPTDNNYRGISRGRLVCDYCKRPGHSQGPRYNNRGKRVVASGKGVTDVNTAGKEIESKTQDDGRNVNLTEEQYGQLVSLLQQFHGRNGDAGKSSGSSYSSSINTANFAGMIVCTSSIDFGKLSCKCFESKTDTWILDSGASNHMNFNKSLMSNIEFLPYPFLVVLPNGYKVKVSKIGDVVLTSKIVLQKVLFVPSFKFNLAPSVKRPLEIGKVRNGLYLICSKCLRDNNSSVTLNHSCDSSLNQMHNIPTSTASTFTLNDGYPFGVKGYKVLDLSTKKIHITRDVIFHEFIFPFEIHFKSKSESFPTYFDVFPSNELASHNNITEMFTDDSPSNHPT